jgi:hypothetical protein
VMAELWSATLNPKGPNYERLKDIFPHRVPLKSPQTVKAQLGSEKDVPVYMLNFAGMTLGQRARLFAIVAAGTSVPVSVIEQVAAKDGFPIREADVVVSFDMRAFV